MSTLFIADLHLTENNPKDIENFVKFIHEKALHTEALYILGDLFAAWIGLDHEKKLNRTIIEALKHLQKTHIKVYLQPGNRDFLITKKFCKLAGCQLLQDPTVVDIYGTPVLLSHGDLFCTKDIKYQLSRKTLRNHFLKKIFLIRSLKKRMAMLKKIQLKNEQNKNTKTPEMMDTVQETIEKYMNEHDVQHLIHGHTHKPTIDKFDLNGKEATRIVLNDWDKQPNMLICHPGEKPHSLKYELIDL